MKFDENLAALHGYLCADGYVSKNLPTQKHKYYSIGLRNTNNHLLRDFQQRFYTVFSIKPTLINKERCRIYSKEIYYKLMPIGPFYSRNWAFPSLQKRLLKFWLRAFFDCESWVVAKSAQDRRIAVESINKEGLLKIRDDLKKKFRIESSFYARKNRKTAGLHVYGKQNLIKYQKEIGFLHPDKNKKLIEAIKSFADYRWNFPKEKKKKELFLKALIKERARVKIPRTIRFNSIIKKNISKLSEELFKSYKIESRTYERMNSQGTKYYELAIYKEKYGKKLLKKGLLRKDQHSKLRLAFK